VDFGLVGWPELTPSPVVLLQSAKRDAVLRGSDPTRDELEVRWITLLGMEVVCKSRIRKGHVVLLG
jgi:hypothetical protein